MKKPEKTLMQERMIGGSHHRGSLLSVLSVKDEEGNVVKVYDPSEITFTADKYYVTFLVNEPIPNPNYEREMKQYEEWKAKRIAHLEGELNALRGES